MSAELNHAENKHEFWVARDLDGTIALYFSEPKLFCDHFAIADFSLLLDEHFPEVLPGQKARLEMNLIIPMKK